MRVVFMGTPEFALPSLRAPAPTVWPDEGAPSRRLP
jgi:hypothetical protein